MENKKSLYYILGAIVVVVIAGIIGVIVKTMNKEEVPVTYNVTFNTGGGSTISDQKIKEGEKVTKPTNPTKEGYIFVEWTNNGNTYDFNSAVTSNLTLIAKWEKVREDVKTYVVEFDTDGGTTIANQVIEKGQKIVKPVDPVKANYVFKEWQLDGKTYNFDTEVTTNLKLKAKWEEVKQTNGNNTNNNGNSGNNGNNGNTTKPNNPTTPTKKKYSVSFNSNGGSLISSQSVIEGNKASKPKDPTRSGYTFEGWTLDGKSYDFNTIVTKNITLVASWSKIANKYTVTFNSDGGSSVNSQTITEGNKATKPSNPAKEGYKFVEWQLDGKTYDFNIGITKNITLTAKWQPLSKYTVTFNSDGGTSVGSQTITEGNKVTQPASPTKEGYKFNGWLLNGSAYNFNNPVTSNITLTASWVQKSYTISRRKTDSYSPDNLLTVYEEGSVISVQRIEYIDGGIICFGNNLSASDTDLLGVTRVVVVLNSGIKVTATIN